MSRAASLLVAVRHSHDRLAGLTKGLGSQELARPSACSQWTVAEVLSHLGSQAEIFSLFVDAGLSGGDPPSSDAYGPIWDAWNARTAEQQAADSVAANEALVARLEALGQDVLDGFRLELFGRSMDAAGLLRMRLSEHAVHTWDIAVSFDPTAEIDAEAVALLVDGLGEAAARSGKAPDEPLQVVVVTTAPDRRYVLDAGAAGVRLEPAGTDFETDLAIELPAEALVRLVYGRLDGVGSLRGPVRLESVDLADLTSIFPGF